MENIIIEDPACRTTEEKFFIGIPLEDGSGLLEVSKEEYERIYTVRKNNKTSNE